MRDTSKLPENLQPVFNLLDRAFPDPLTNEEYVSILHVLSENLSQRAIASVVQCMVDRDYYAVWNDVLGVQSATGAPARSGVTRVRERLQACGYREVFGDDPIRPLDY
jgi:hypothetical protein